MQNYNVHTYVISMEFLAVNRRRPSCETPLGPGAKKDGCFHRLYYTQVDDFWDSHYLFGWQLIKITRRNKKQITLT